MHSHLLYVCDFVVLLQLTLTSSASVTLTSVLKFSFLVVEGASGVRMKENNLYEMGRH